MTFSLPPSSSLLKVRFPHFFFFYKFVLSSKRSLSEGDLTLFTVLGGGGGGFYSSGRSSKNPFGGSMGTGGEGGKGFLQGGVGGRGWYFNADGGFGGGGGAYGWGGGGGGGGGYSGGSSGENLNDSCGGGGGSYNSGKNQQNECCYNSAGHGQVTITLL